MVIWVDRTEHLEVVTVEQIDAWGPQAAAARGVNRALTLAPDGIIRLPRFFRLRPAREFVVDADHADVVLANEQAQQHLYRLWEQLHRLYPQYEVLPKGLSQKDVYFAKALEHGYHEQIHRRHTLWGLPRWVYFNQHRYPNLRVMPLWWYQLFSDCVEHKRLSELMGVRERRLRKRRLRTRVRPRRRV
mgnify:CR=1 FL=1